MTLDDYRFKCLWKKRAALIMTFTSFSTLPRGWLSSYTFISTVLPRAWWNQYCNFSKMEINDHLQRMVVFISLTRRNSEIILAWKSWLCDTAQWGHTRYQSSRVWAPWLSRYVWWGTCQTWWRGCRGRGGTTRSSAPPRSRSSPGYPRYQPYWGRLGGHLIVGL